MSRSRRQLRVRNPNVLLLPPLLARPHCHAHILRTKPVDTSTFFAHASRLAPQADRHEVVRRWPVLPRFPMPVSFSERSVVDKIALLGIRRSEPPFAVELPPQRFVDVTSATE